jgi:hypothetical protein
MALDRQDPTLTPLAARPLASPLDACLGRRRALPANICTYRALLGLILNAAVTDGHLPHAPCRHRRSAGLPGPVRSGSPESSFNVSPMPSNPRYRALVLTAAHTGVRWSELVALHWEDFRPDLPLDDGAPTASSSTATLARTLAVGGDCPAILVAPRTISGEYRDVHQMQKQINL